MLRLIGLLLRIYSYLYHIVLCLFLLAIAIVTMAGGVHNLNLPMLPWKGQELTLWILWASIAGLISTILAMTGIFRFLFPIWCLAVLVMMVRGYFLGMYVYEGPGHFRSVVLLVAGALLAFLASLTLLKARKSGRR